MNNYNWNEINEALLATGHSPKQIANVLAELNKKS